MVVLLKYIKKEKNTQRDYPRKQPNRNCSIQPRSEHHALRSLSNRLSPHFKPCMQKHVVKSKDLKGGL